MRTATGLARFLRPSSPGQDVQPTDRDGEAAGVRPLQCQLQQVRNSGGKSGKDIGELLIVNDAWGALTTALAKYKPWTLSDSYLSHAATRENLVRNRIERNAGPGILLALSTADGLPFRATNIVVARNRIVGNGLGAAPEEAGILFQGGQDDGRGWVRVTGNLIAGNAGPGLQGGRRDGTVLRVIASANRLEANGATPATSPRRTSSATLRTSSGDSRRKPSARRWNRISLFAG